MILNSPENLSYETLKFELIKRVCSSQEEKTRLIQIFQISAIDAPNSRTSRENNKLLIGRKS